MLDKGDPFEMSAKVPFLLYAPGLIEPGSKFDQVMTMIDFKPTILGLMGLKAGVPSDGEDASAVLLKKDDTWDNIKFIRGMQNWVCAVDDRYKLIICNEEENGGAIFLDREIDPWEMENHIDKPENKARIATMARALRQYCIDHKDPCYEKEHTFNTLEELT